MLGAITQDQFEQMRQQLIVPLAVTDILKYDLNVEPDMQYSLHMALSEADPDSALLAIALCAQDLAAKCIKHAPIANILQKEAADLLADYGPSWLHNNLNAPIPSYVYEDILDTIPEDLEGLADLIDALYAELGEENSPIATLARLLSIQARAHMEIAEFVLAEIAYEKQVYDAKEEKPNFGFDTREIHTEETINKYNFAGNNIIVFPGSA